MSTIFKNAIKGSDISHYKFQYLLKTDVTLVGFRETSIK